MTQTDKIQREDILADEQGNVLQKVEDYMQKLISQRVYDLKMNKAEEKEFRDGIAEILSEGNFGQ